MRRFYVFVMCVLMVLCVGCTKGDVDVNPNIETESPGGDTELIFETEQDDVENTQIETTSDGLVHSELSADMLVSDAQMTKNVLQLILDEKKLIDTIESECEIDSADLYELDGRVYYRVIEADSWDYYVDIAKEYYSEDALEKFVSRYIDETKLFVEVEDKLYRAMADAVIVSIYEDSMEIWKAEENTYYVTILVNSVGGGDYYEGYRIQVSENNSYGFEIVDKMIVY